jgi:hypothetical protein
LGAVDAAVAPGAVGVLSTAQGNHCMRAARSERRGVRARRSDAGDEQEPASQPAILALNRELVRPDASLEKRFADCKQDIACASACQTRGLGRLRAGALRGRRACDCSHASLWLTRGRLFSHA